MSESKVASACDDQGFVFATTGPEYTILAQRAARTLRLHMPDANVDLFTDQQVEDTVFNKVFKLERSWFRPKIEAMRRTRFERTVILDADIIVLMDVSELFDVLHDFDLAAAGALNRGPVVTKTNPPIPRSFPFLNSGVLGIRKSAKMEAFSEEWERRLNETQAPYDQIILRQMLYEDMAKFCVYPQEYNIFDVAAFDRWRPIHGAPRILHLTELHKRPPGSPLDPFDLRAEIGQIRGDHVSKLIQFDEHIGQGKTFQSGVLYINSEEELELTQKRLRTFRKNKNQGKKWRGGQMREPGRD
ncbi:hypothetical protein NBRC116590_19410 [Pelagimonas sp. KU-00592-HH]|uniref:putative nucleotide-diphospho-sugar transferase n=1 Tax=Pelagimonas sp. KU-00592-HH TaxID=3127651 RepID=UPI003102F458